jgi:hypothetical protein
VLKVHNLWHHYKILNNNQFGILEVKQKKEKKKKKNYLLKPTFMHYIVYIKSHTNFHSDTFQSENQ